MANLALDELNALFAVAESRSFRAAAKQLGVSPSALSHSISRIEEKLGVRLFNRTTRSVSLTEVGQHFIVRVHPAMNEIASAIEAVNQFRDTPTGLLRLNASEGGGERILPIVLEFMAAYPNMAVDIAMEGRMVDIVAEGFDAGVRGDYAIPKDMIALSLGVEEAFAVVAAPNFFDEKGIPKNPTDLLNHTNIRVRMPSGAVQPWEFERDGKEINVDPPSKLIVGAPALAIQAAKAGAGVAYVVARSVAADLASGSLIRVLTDWTPPFSCICLYYPRQRLHSAGLAAFIEHFKLARRRQGPIFR